MVYLGGTGRRISSLRPAQVKGSETLAQKQTNKQTNKNQKGLQAQLKWRAIA
jgi:hypothetical protein